MTGKIAETVFLFSEETDTASKQTPIFSGALGGVAGCYSKVHHGSRHQLL